MTASPIINNAAAIKAVKDRFIRLPSNYSSPRFRDLVSGIEQSDAGLIVKCYRENGGKSHGAEQLLDEINFMSGEVFKPGTGSIVDGMFLNLWQPPLVKPSGQVPLPNQVTPFLEFMNRLFPDSLDRSYFVWWLAHVVRRPEIRITATPLLRSEQGVGKGFLAETLLAGLIGRPSVGVCRMTHLIGAHNEVVEGKIVLMIDEVDTASPRALNELKSYQGNSTLPLNRKHKPAIFIDNYINFIITSNAELPFTIEAGDRRYWVPDFIRHRVTVDETVDFINGTLKPWFLKDGGIQLVRDYLELVGLENYKPTASPPMTSSKKQLMGIEEVKLEDVIGPVIAQNKVVTVEMIKAIAANDHSLSVTAIAVSNALKRMRCERKSAKLKRYYITPIGLKSGLSTATAPKELEQYLS